MTTTAASRSAKLPRTVTVASVMAALLMLLAAPGSHAAGAFGQLQQMGGGAGSVPDVPAPECVANCPGSSGGGSGGTESGEGGSRGIFNWIDIWQQRSAARAAARRTEALRQNEQGVAAYKRGDYAEALRLQELALEGDPDNAVMRNNVKMARAALAKAQQEARNRAQKQQAQDAYRQRMQELGQLMPAIATLPGADRPLAPTPPPLPGFAPAAWQEYRSAQAVVERLYAKLNRDGALSDADAKVFYAALQRRNALWSAATSGAALSARERSRLRLTLPVTVERGAVPAAGDATQRSNQPIPDRRAGASRAPGEPARADAITTAFVAEFFADQGIQALGAGLGDAIEGNRGAGAKDGYARLLGWGRVAVAASEGGAAAAGAATTDLILAQMPESMSARAEHAVQGGRLYSKVVYRALDRFMGDSTRITGGSFDSEAFWARFQQELTTWQKGTAKWIEFGE